MFEIDHYKSEIFSICKSLRVKRLDLFGSATGESFSSKSDVDVLVEFERYKGGNLFDRYFDLKEKLQLLFNREVDVVVEKAIQNPYFKEKLQNTRKTIYAG
ncbi:MAG: nucleotidyltransferase domain-containing protein [SAR324 cluster bacterium]|nr:nucleotidyltransferase domain-containing protein [SAR324 cluster bacterium]